MKDEVVVLAIILIFAFGFLQESQGAIFVKVLTENPDQVQIVFERHRCFGTCPAYYFMIFGTGEAYLYNDPSSDSLSIGSVEKADIEFLLNEFEKSNFFDYNALYDLPYTDLSATSTALKLGERQFYVYNYGGAGPSSLRMLEEKIDRIKDNIKFESIELTKERCDKLYSNTFYFLGKNWSEVSKGYCYYAVDHA